MSIYLRAVQDLVDSNDTEALKSFGYVSVGQAKMSLASKLEAKKLVASGAQLPAMARNLPEGIVTEESVEYHSVTIGNVLVAVADIVSAVTATKRNLEHDGKGNFAII